MSVNPGEVVLTAAEAAALVRYIAAKGITYNADDGLIMSVLKKVAPLPEDKP